MAAAAVINSFLENLVEIHSVLFLTSLIPISVVFQRRILPLSIIHGESAQSYLKAFSGAILIGFVSAGFLRSIHPALSWDVVFPHSLILYDLRIISSLFILVVSSISLHLINYKISVSQIFQSNTSKWWFYGFSIFLITLLSFSDGRSAFVITMGCAIYFLLLDLFIEERKASLIWLVVWTIVIGSFLSLSLFQITQWENPDIHIPLLYGFSLFSLIFLIAGFLFIALALANRKNKLFPQEWDFNFSRSRQLRYRIQLSILLVLIFSFIAVGLVSVYHFKLFVAPGELDQLNAQFVQALLNTYVFLFLIGFSISISLAEYIRNPLIELGRTLKAVKLNKDNKKIVWKANDEIGNLISEYNSMIDKLQANATLFAQSERDSAWREMAKQVAHEIKNPLTPMKLSLQHLEKSVLAKRDNLEELTLRMCDTLMDQIESLRQIADEFSNFGKLPKANNEKVHLNEIVETIHDLFRKRGDMEINLIEPIDDIGVYADKNQLVRILNNLIKNSIQSIPSDRKGSIELKLWKEGNKAIIRVSDNGVGIPDSMKDQIFKPKFTTKTSGSGLGLAISANMVDSIGGSIYFESKEGEGSRFFVELPLIRSEYSENLVRVSLDS